MKKCPLCLCAAVVMPYTLLSFDAGRDKSVAAIENAAENDGLVFLTAQKTRNLPI